MPLAVKSLISTFPCVEEKDIKTSFPLKEMALNPSLGILHNKNKSSSYS